MFLTRNTHEELIIVVKRLHSSCTIIRYAQSNASAVLLSQVQPTAIHSVHILLMIYVNE